MTRGLRAHPAAPHAYAAVLVAGVLLAAAALSLHAAVPHPAPLPAATVTVPGPTVTTSYLLYVTPRPGQTPAYYTPPVRHG